MKIASLVFGDNKRYQSYNIIRFLFRTRYILALIIILLVAPQTPKENVLLIEFLESGFFMDYGEAKYFLNRLTWITISLFLIVHMIK